MGQWPRIRRLPGGAIDYDFYRRRARAQHLPAVEAFVTPGRLSGLGTALTVLARLRTTWKS